MKEERRQILQMLAEGKITADEAERLLDALGQEQQASSPAGPRPKYLRVLVEDNTGIDGPGRVNIRVPLQLLRAGVRLTRFVPPQALTRINAALDKSGVPIDVTELKPQHIEELIEQLGDLTVDVGEPDSNVQIFCE